MNHRAAGGVLLPGIAQVEQKARRQVEHLLPLPVLLVDHQHTHAQLGAPLVRVQHARPGQAALHVVHQRGQQEDEVPGRDRKVMHHGHVAERERIGAPQRPCRGDLVQQQQAVVGIHAKVPDRAVGLHPGVGREGHACQVCTPGLEAPGLQRAGVQARGRAALPQRQHVAPHGQHADVGGVHAVGRAGWLAAREHGAKAFGQPAARLDFGLPLGGGHVAALVVHGGAADHKTVGHPVAVKPVLVTLSAQVVARRAHAVQRARHSIRKAPAHQGGGQRNVCRRRGKRRLPWRLGLFELNVPAGGRRLCTRRTVCQRCKQRAAASGHEPQHQITAMDGHEDASKRTSADGW